MIELVTNLNGSIAASWLPLFLVTYAVEFLCMCAAKLMVLDRMSGFASLEGARLQKRLAAAGRVVMAVVVLGNAAGLAANAASAAYYLNAVDAAREATAALSANNTKSADTFLLLTHSELQRGSDLASVQRFSELTVLLLMLLAFLAVGAACARLLVSRSGGFDAGYDTMVAKVGKPLRLQVMCTTGFVFATFLLRSVFATMYSVAYVLRSPQQGPCPALGSGCDQVCFNVFFHISTWLFYTPEFQAMVILISSPLTLLVALWGMTSKATLQVMKKSDEGVLLTVSLIEPQAAPRQTQQ
jgi:hypothetical protein